MAYRSLLALTASVSFAALSAGAAHAQAAGGTQLEEITVQGQAPGAASGQGGGGAAAPVQGAPGVATNDGYVAKTTRTATKTDTPVHETPQTINTVTQKQLEDRRPQSLQEALTYTPGARIGAFGFDPRYDSFTIRGADVTYTGVFRDGLRQFNSPNGLFRLEPYGIEQISILKGPASAIYGASASAGIVDLVSKRPTDYKFGEVEAQTGSFNRIQGSFDFGGPVNDEGTVLYRFTGLARDAGTELKAVSDDRVFFAPAVTFKPTDDTKLTLLAEYMDATTGGSAAYWNRYDADGNSLGAIRRPLALKDFNDFNQKQGRFGYEFEHTFNETFSIHQNLRYSGLNTDQEYSGSQFGDTGLIKERMRSFTADTFLKTKAFTGPVEHTILTGVDYGYSKYTSRVGYGGFTDPNDIPTPALLNKDRQTQQLVGAYAQDEIKIDRWRLLLGGRHDWFKSSFRSDQPQLGAPYDGSPDKQNKGKFTGRAGLSYVTPQGFTPYVSYGTSFTPNAGAVLDPDGAGPEVGGVAKPTVGETVEAGVKYDVPGYNASINGSVFWLKQKDGVVYAVTGGSNQQTQLDFRSRGVELDATATLANGINILATYTYTDTKILDPRDLKGNELSSIPKHAFALWGGYDFKTGPLNGLGLGLGVRYDGTSEGDTLNRSVIANKARAFVDGKISYDFGAQNPQLKGVSLQVTGTNLLDKSDQVCSSNYCYYDKGRQVIASIRYRW